MGLTVHFEVLNQLGTPMMYSATLANRPAAGIAGRIFFRTDSPYGIFRDTGSAWDQIAGSGGGGGNTIYTADDTLTSNRTVSSGGFTLVFTPQTTFFSSLTAAVNASSFSVLGSNTLTYAAGFSSNNIGNVYSANGAINSQIFVGNATFAQANLASAMVNVNKIDFSSGGHTVTMTQASGIRAMTGVQNQIQFVGSHNGTITHAAVSQNLGFFRDTGSTRTLTITNAYSHLINALDDYGAGFTFTNRWGIYQAGTSDKNYFAGNILSGSTTDTGEKLQITGTSLFTDKMTISKNQNAFTFINVSNTTSGSNAISGITLTNNASVNEAQLFLTSTTYTPYRAIAAGDFGIYKASAGDITFYHDFSTGKIKFAAGNAATSQMTLTAAGRLLLGTTTENSFIFDAVGTSRITGDLTLTTAGASNYNLIVNTNSALNASVISFTSVGNITNGYILSAAPSFFFGTYAAKETAFVGNGVVSMRTNDTGYIRFMSGNADPNFSTEKARITNAGRLLLGTATEGTSILRIVGLPTSPVGLIAGEVWNNSGTLTIV
jgi:hypothetical protein